MISRRRPSCTSTSVLTEPILGMQGCIMTRFAVMLAVVFALGACWKPQPPPVSTRELSRVVSPAGWCVASVVVFEDSTTISNTQILLSFDGGRCGSGAVYFDGGDVPLELRWIDAATLEVRCPAGASFRRNASGEVIQCWDRKVQVIVSPV